eukprot:1158282-Pelagomonas_calceolata.AAC.10
MEPLKAVRAKAAFKEHEVPNKGQLGTLCCKHSLASLEGFEWGWLEAAPGAAIHKNPCGTLEPGRGASLPRPLLSL